MSSLDDISFKLGELSEGMKMLAARAEEQDLAADEIKTALGEIKTRLKPLVEDVAAMKPHVQHYQKVRRYAASVVAGIVTVSGVVGGAVSDYVLRKF